MSDIRLLIVHSDPSTSALMRSMLQSLGYPIEEASSDRSAVRWLDRCGVGAVLASVDPFDPDALELLSYCRRKHPQVPVILLFAVPHPEKSREAVQRGPAAGRSRPTIRPARWRRPGAGPSSSTTWTPCPPASN